MMKSFLMFVIKVSAILGGIGALIYVNAMRTCAPIVQERMTQGHDNAPTLCGAEFYLYIPIAVIIWLIVVIVALLRWVKERKL